MELWTLSGLSSSRYYWSEGLLPCSTERGNPYVSQSCIWIYLRYSLESRLIILNSQALTLFFWHTNEISGIIRKVTDVLQKSFKFQMTITIRQVSLSTTAFSESHSWRSGSADHSFLKTPGHQSFQRVRCRECPIMAKKMAYQTWNLFSSLQQKGLNITKEVEKNWEKKNILSVKSMP